MAGISRLRSIVVERCQYMVDLQPDLVLGCHLYTKKVAEASVHKNLCVKLYKCLLRRCT